MMIIKVVVNSERGSTRKPMDVIVREYTIACTVFRAVMQLREAIVAHHKLLSFLLFLGKPWPYQALQKSTTHSASDLNC